MSINAVFVKLIPASVAKMHFIALDTSAYYFARLVILAVLRSHAQLFVATNAKI